MRQPLYASLVGLGAASEVACAVGTLIPALLMSDGKPKGGWISGLVGLAACAKAVLSGFNPVKASVHFAGLSKSGALNMACCGLALLAGKCKTKLGAELDLMDASSTRGTLRKAWREGAARDFQARADTVVDQVVQTVLDEPGRALNGIGEKLRRLRAGHAQSTLTEPTRSLKP